MIALLQRVSSASVAVEGMPIGEIGKGILVFLGVEKTDNATNVKRLAHRVIHYRLFSDPQGRMNLNVQQIAGSLLIIPQFTLAADTKSGLRPAFSRGASPEQAKKYYLDFCEYCRLSVSTALGEFGANMQVSLTNDGPVTFWLQL